MLGRIKINKIEFGGYLYSFNTDNGGRFTSPNGGYVVTNGANGTGGWYFKSEEHKASFEKMREQSKYWNRYLDFIYQFNASDYFTQGSMLDNLFLSGTGISMFGEYSSNILDLKDSWTFSANGQAYNEYWGDNGKDIDLAAQLSEQAANSQNSKDFARYSAAALSRAIGKLVVAKWNKSDNYLTINGATGLATSIVIDGVWIHLKEGLDADYANELGWNMMQAVVNGLMSLQGVKELILHGLVDISGTGRFDVDDINECEGGPIGSGIWAKYMVSEDAEIDVNTKREKDRIVIYDFTANSFIVNSGPFATEDPGAIDGAIGGHLKFNLFTNAISSTYSVDVKPHKIVVFGIVASSSTYFSFQINDAWDGAYGIDRGHYNSDPYSDYPGRGVFRRP